MEHKFKHLKNRCLYLQHFSFIIRGDFDFYSVLQPPCCIALMTCMILANKIVHEKAKIDSGCLYGGQVLGSCLKFFAKSVINGRRFKISIYSIKKVLNNDEILHHRTKSNSSGAFGLLGVIIYNLKITTGF